MEKVTSADGTTIAYDRLGSGAPLILVGGALCDRRILMPLAEELARELEVLVYDRRGRGDSGDTPAYSVQREVEDLSALLAAAGGSAAVYGHSSGAALTAIAASQNLPFAKVVLHEAPYGPDDAEPSDDASAVLRLLAEGRHREAVERHLTMTGLPQHLAAEYAPQMVPAAPTLAYDYAVLDITNGSRLPEALLAKITAPTLSLAGTASPPFMIDTARRIATVVPTAEYAALPDQHHVVPPEVLAPVVVDFVRR
ncbi:MAG TPA: alpha/beta hydrolase [Kribbella sp.]